MRIENDPFGVVTSDLRFAPKEPSPHYYGDNFLDNFYLSIYETAEQGLNEGIIATSKEQMFEKHYTKEDEYDEKS